MYIHYAIPVLTFWYPRTVQANTFLSH